MMVFLGIAMPLFATDYDTTIVVNSSADTIGLSQLKAKSSSSPDDQKENRICVKNSEKIVINLKDFDFKSYGYGSGVSYNEEEQVVEVTTVGRCYFNYYVQDGSRWSVFMDVNRFGVLQYQGADAPDTLYVEEAELDSVVGIPEGDLSSVLWYGLKDGKTSLIDKDVSQSTKTESLRTLLSSGYSSFVASFYDKTSNYLEDGTLGGESYDTLTIVVKESVLDSATVTLRTLEGGVMSGAGKYQVGDTATICAYPSEHYHFLYWQDTKGNEISKEAEYSFVVESDTTLYACFEKDAKQGHIITFSIEGGSGSLVATVDGNAISSGDAVAEGTVILFTLTPDDGYELRLWKQNGVELSGVTATTLSIDNLLVDTDIVAVLANTTGIVQETIDITNDFEVYTLSGVKLPNKDLSSLPSGVYLLKQGGKTLKLRLK